MRDMHAVSGDGEFPVCGVESAGSATVRGTVVKGEKLPTPCLITSDGANFATIQSEKDLMTASKKACNMMLDYLLANTDLDVYDGTRLLSIAGNLIICQIVNDYPTVRMEIDKGILDKYGIKLP
jgi:amidase